MVEIFEIAQNVPILEIVYLLQIVDMLRLLQWLTC